MNQLVVKNVAPNPVEYLAGAVNSCISISAGMIANVHHLDVKISKLQHKQLLPNWAMENPLLVKC